jgi:hypothetical protein
VPEVIDEQLFEADTPIKPREEIRSRLIDVRGAQHVSVNLFRGPGGGAGIINSNIAFCRTANSRLVHHRHDAFEISLSISIPVCGPLFVISVQSELSAPTICGGWVYGVRDALR